MNQHRKSSDLKDMAKGKLGGHYGSAVLTCILPSLICSLLLIVPLMVVIFIFTFVSLTSSSGLSIPLLIAIVLPITLLGMVAEAMFTPGMILYFLNTACHRRASISDIFFGFRWQFKKTLVLSLLRLAISGVCLLPYIYCYLQYVIDSDRKWLFYVVVFFLLGLVVSYPFLLMLSQVFYLLLDFPKYSVAQLIKTSAHIMKGHKGRLLYVMLSFFPLALLCSLCPIGTLWLNPYRQMTMSLFYLDLMNPQNQALA